MGVVGCLGGHKDSMAAEDVDEVLAWLDQLVDVRGRGIAVICERIGEGRSA